MTKVGRWTKGFIDKYFKTMLVAFFVFVLASIAFFSFFPFNVAEIKKINIIGTVQAGSLIKYKVDYCQNVGAGVERHTRRFLVPENPGLTEPIELSSNPSLETLQNSGGCKTSKEIKLPVDASVPPGKYKVLIQIRYCILPVRCLPVEGYSDSFEVMKPDVPTQLSLIYEQLDQIQRATGATPPTGNANVMTIPETPQSNNMEQTIITPSTIVQPQEQPAERPRGILESTTEFVNNLLNIVRI